MNEQRELAQDRVNLSTAERLGEISSNVKTILESQQRLFAMYGEHDKRINIMERGLSSIKIKIGVAASIVGAFTYAIASWIWNKLTSHT